MASPFFFFFNDTATTEIYTLSLHDALPISPFHPGLRTAHADRRRPAAARPPAGPGPARSEEHTSELQSPCNLVCRLLLEKKNPPPPRGRSRLRPARRARAPRPRGPVRTAG